MRTTILGIKVTLKNTTFLCATVLGTVNGQRKVWELCQAWAGFLTFSALLVAMTDYLTEAATGRKGSF